MTVWLIWWEHASTEEREVAAILNYRHGGETIRRTVELMYVNSQSMSTRLAYARNPKAFPYKAQFDRLIDGIKWEGSITCGHNPYLRARQIKDVHVEVDENGNEKLIWTEPAMPLPPGFRQNSAPPNPPPNR